MADELLVSASIDFKKAGLAKSKATGGISMDVAGTKYSEVVQAVGIAEEVLTLSGLAGGGYVLLQNLDTTNFISYRGATGIANSQTLLAGDVALFRIPAGGAPCVQADTAECELLVILIEA